MLMYKIKNNYKQHTKIPKKELDNIIKQHKKNTYNFIGIYIIMFKNHINS